LEAARRNPFSSKVLSDTFVVCLECGRLFKALAGHVPKKHHMSIDEYKELYGYNRSQPLMSEVLLERHVEIGKALPQHEHVMEALNRARHTGPRDGGISKRPQAMPRLIKRNRRQAQAVPKGQDSPLYRKDVTPERVAELRAQGLKKLEIAALLQCDPRVVWQRMKEAGINRPRRRLDITTVAVANAYAAGTRSIQALQDRFRCGANLIRKHLRKAGIIVPSPAPDALSNEKTTGRKPRVPNRPDVTPEAVAAAHQQGMSWKRMQEHFQISEAAIRLRLRQAGAVLKHDAPAERTDIATEDLVAARERGMSIKAICARFQCGEALVRRRLKVAGVPQTSIRERADIVADEVAQAATVAASPNWRPCGSVVKNSCRAASKKLEGRSAGVVLRRSRASRCLGRSSRRCWNKA
jgi:uncharacterized protein (DUF433 family)